jgi:hypothetical protein
VFALDLATTGRDPLMSGRCQPAAGRWRWAAARGPCRREVEVRLGEAVGVVQTVSAPVVLRIRQHQAAA